MRADIRKRLDLSCSERKILTELLVNGPMTASELGAAIWGTPFRKPQHYARPAGRICRRLAARGLVMRLAPAGRRADRLATWELLTVAALEALDMQEAKP